MQPSSSSLQWIWTVEAIAQYDAVHPGPMVNMEDRLAYIQHYHQERQREYEALPAWSSRDYPFPSGSK